MAKTLCYMSTITIFLSFIALILSSTTTSRKYTSVDYNLYQQRNEDRAKCTSSFANFSCKELLSKQPNLCAYQNQPENNERPAYSEQFAVIKKSTCEKNGHRTITDLTVCKAAAASLSMCDNLVEEQSLAFAATGCLDSRHQLVMNLYTTKQNDCDEYDRCICQKTAKNTTVLEPTKKRRSRALVEDTTMNRQFSPPVRYLSDPRRGKDDEQLKDGTTATAKSYCKKEDVNQKKGSQDAPDVCPFDLPLKKVDVQQYIDDCSAKICKQHSNGNSNANCCTWDEKLGQCFPTLTSGKVGTDFNGTCRDLWTTPSLLASELCCSDSPATTGTAEPAYDESGYGSGYGGSDSGGSYTRPAADGIFALLTSLIVIVGMVPLLLAGCLHSQGKIDASFCCSATSACSSTTLSSMGGCGFLVTAFIVHASMSYSYWENPCLQIYEENTRYYFSQQMYEYEDAVNSKCQKNSACLNYMGTGSTSAAASSSSSSSSSSSPSNSMECIEYQNHSSRVVAANLLSLVALCFALYGTVLNCLSLCCSPRDAEVGIAQPVNGGIQAEVVTGTVVMMTNMSTTSNGSVVVREQTMMVPSTGSQQEQEQQQVQTQQQEQQMHPMEEVQVTRTSVPLAFPAKV